MENLLPLPVRQNYHLLAVMVQKLPNGQLPVAADHSQLRTMASETVNTINWSLPPPITGQYPLSVQVVPPTCTAQHTLQINSVSRMIPGPYENWPQD